MPLYFFYTMVQKCQKSPKIQIKGGPALIIEYLTLTGTVTPHWTPWAINQTSEKACTGRFHCETRSACYISRASSIQVISRESAKWECSVDERVCIHYIEYGASSPFCQRKMLTTTNKNMIRHFTHTHTHTHTHAHARTCARAHTRTRACTRMHAHTPARAHTHTRTHAHAHAHTRACTHTFLKLPKLIIIDFFLK